MRKILLVFFAAFMFLFSAYSITFAAQECTVNEKTDINPNKSDFKACKEYSDDISHIYSGYSSNGSVLIYEYEAPKSGYYAIYTTGNTDTVGRVYEYNNFLWYKSYDDISGIVDDCLNYDGTRNYNFKTVVKLDKYENYYICVRAYGTKSGSFDLHVEPNDDKITCVKGGTWTSNTIIPLNDTGVLYRTYFNQEQTKALIQIVRNDLDNKIIENYYKEEGVVGVTKRICDALGIVISIIPMSQIASIGLSMSEKMLDLLYNNVYMYNTTFLEKTLVFLLNNGCGWKMMNGYDEYYANNGVILETKSIASNAMPFFENEWYVYNGVDANENIYRGVIYDYGKWA